jgi:hypothetical protein
MSIYGNRWGEYPSDSELNRRECSCGGVKHYFESLCTESCKDELSEEIKSEEIISDLLRWMVESVEEYVQNEDKCVDYYTVNYGVVPVEWRDENGDLIGLIYYSNSEETRKMWGTSLTIRMDDDDDASDLGCEDDYRLGQQEYWW